MKSLFLLFAVSIALSLASVDGAEESKPMRLLFVGNSITLHPPAPGIGWTGHWGMAASSEEKDYVHLLAEDVAKWKGAPPEIRVANAADFERGSAAYDAPAQLKEELAFPADAVIVAIGENVPALPTEDAKASFESNFVKLLTLLRGERQTPIYVRSCFWADATKDLLLKEACAKVEGVFVDISALSKDEANYARAERKIEHPGVAAHPGDQGMRAIADAIFSAMKEHN